jgi:Nucleotide-diphospho-sugar transferase
MIVIKPSIEASVPSMPRPYLPVKKSRKPLSFGSIATLILCAAVGGFNVGYTIGVNAYKPQMQDNSGIPREQQCPCNQVQTPNKRLELVNDKEPCPIVTCPVVDQPCPSCRICNDEANKRNDSSLADGLNDRKADINHEPIFPKSIQKIAVGMSRVPRDEFSTTFDMGVPLQKTVQGNEHVLILYTHNNALPTMAKESYSRGSAPLVTSAEDATANCDYLNVILTDVKYEKKQCVALMGQFEASHIQRWMRLPEKGLQVNSKEPLRFVGRIAKDMGGASVVTAPFPSEANSNREILHQYFEELESVMKELGPLATKVARNNTVVVMFSNFGQSELIVNFYCSAQNRNLDLSSVLFFATDPETKELVESLGMTAFYSEALFGHLPSGAAEAYGDETFSVMMKTKIKCIHLTSLLGFDILFQDADMIWYRDPIPYFQKENLPFFDVFIADDGNDNSI